MSPWGSEPEKYPPYGASTACGMFSCTHLGGRQADWTGYLQKHSLHPLILAEGSSVLNELYEAVWLINTGRVGLELFLCSFLSGISIWTSEVCIFMFYCNQNEQKRALETECHECHISLPTASLSSASKSQSLRKTWKSLADTENASNCHEMERIHLRWRFSWVLISKENEECSSKFS